MAIASKTTAVKTSEVKTTETLDASALVAVKNISDRTLCLSTGQLLAGDDGKASVAEVSMLSAYLTKVE